MALKTAVDMVMGMRYKLRMMGITIDGHTHMRVDNISVVKNTSVSESTLKKKAIQLLTIMYAKLSQRPLLKLDMKRHRQIELIC
jgi:hypothetical protein